LDLMSMRAKGKLEAVFDSDDAARSAAAALASETGFGRARVSIRVSGKTLTAEIDADDVVAFRAGANSLLRNLQVFESIEKDITDKDEVPQ